MFDECKGPKFEELLAVFSTAVLIKVVEANDADQSVAKSQLAIPLLDADSQTVLALAYKASLSEHLHGRQALGRRWLTFGRLLASKEEELKQRSQRVEQAAATNQQRKIPQRTLDRLRKHLLQNWTGDPNWVELVMRSDQHLPQGLLLQKPFDDVWKHACDDTLYAIRPERNESPLQSLERRVSEQQSRLHQWKAMREDLMAQKEAMLQTRIHSRSRIADTKHEAKRLRSDVAPPRRSNSARGTPGSRIASQPRKSAEHQKTPSTPHRISHSRSKSEVLGNSLLLQHHAVTNLPRRQANTSVRIATPSQISKFGNRFGKAHRESAPLETVEQSVPSNAQRRSPTRETYVKPFKDEYEQLEDVGMDDDGAADIVSAVLNGRPSPQKTFLSLAERTRMSLAGGSPQKENLPLLPGQRPGQSRLDFSDSIPRTPNALNDLAERTRQSMTAMSLSAKPKEPRVPAKVRPSVVFPINQFQTPPKVETNLENAEESILDDTGLYADEETIFKSRPRVALSPVLTPMAEGRGSLGVVLSLGNESSYEDDFS